MPVWISKARWVEDDADVSERWEVNAPTAQDAIREVSIHFPFQPDHAEARRHPSKPDHEPAGAGPLAAGQVRRIPPP